MDNPYPRYRENGKLDGRHRLWESGYQTGLYDDGARCPTVPPILMRAWTEGRKAGRAERRDDAQTRDYAHVMSCTRKGCLTCEGALARV